MALPQGNSILIVDDNENNLHVLSNTLELQGYQVRCAKSGRMALLAINRFQVDLILLDIRMPGMDGYSVL
ncbi:MAG: response regulator [Leptolyngbya sp. RL_3_1]|nr:response regulator [Leptolyngbya sp. RL_3_1]